MLDISLVTIGFVLVIISYFVSEKFEQGQSGGIGLAEQTGHIHEIWSEKDEVQVRSQVEAVVSQKMNEMIDRTDEELSSISNEKIMAMDEFSNQLLEKIETNHKEVVFLYNMLNTKQDEMKKIVNDIDVSKTSLEDLIHYDKSKTQKSYTGIDLLQHVAKDDKEKVCDKLEKQEKVAVNVSRNEMEEDCIELMEINQEYIEPGIDLESAKLDETQFGLEDSIKESKISIPEVMKEEKLDLKQSVLNLYQEGKSVLEISKLLRIGQGEVKLIIDLYQGAII